MRDLAKREVLSLTLKQVLKGSAKPAQGMPARVRLRQPI